MIFAAAAAAVRRHTRLALADAVRVFCQTRIRCSLSAADR